MSWDQRQCDIRKFPFHHMEIRAADTADMNLNEDLIRLWDWYRPIVKPQRTSGHVAGMVEHHRFHTYRNLKFLGLNALDVQMNVDLVSND